MVRGDANQNISKFASSSTQASTITTSMPYISYVDLAGWLRTMYLHARAAVNAFLIAHPKDTSAAEFKEFCDNSPIYSDVFICDGYRLCRAAKLLMSLGFGNFSIIIQYDIFASAQAYIAQIGSWDVNDFQDYEYALDLDLFEASSITNSPNLSLFPLLAYHKICNDHYRNEKWQPFEPWP